MKTLRNAALTIVTLIPLAELLFVPAYLAHRVSAGLNDLNSALVMCNAADSGCPLEIAGK